MMDIPVDIRESERDGRRLVRLTLHRRMMPYVRQTVRSRWGGSRWARRVREYNDWRATVRDEVILAMRLCNVAPFGEVSLGMSVRLLGRRLNGDLSNYLKAVEDVLNGVLYPDDRLIVEYGPCSKERADEDRTEVEVWETDS